MPPKNRQHPTLDTPEEPTSVAVPAPLEAEQSAPPGSAAALTEIADATPPRPHVVHASWYPAGIVLPASEGRRILQRAKILAADTGLYVFTAADESAPTWFSPIDYQETRRPRTGIMAQNGIPVVTAAGVTLITPMGGCGCGSALKRWMPSWAVREAPWPENT